MSWTKWPRASGTSKTERSKTSKARTKISSCRRRRKRANPAKTTEGRRTGLAKNWRAWLCFVCGPPRKAVPTNLARGCDGDFRVGGAVNSASDAAAGSMTVALVEKSLIQGGKELEDEGLLAAVAHGTEAPDLSLQCADAAGDFNVEFVEELITKFGVLDRSGNHDRGDGDETILRLFHQ